MRRSQGERAEKTPALTRRIYGVDATPTLGRSQGERAEKTQALTRRIYGVDATPTLRRSQGERADKTVGLPAQARRSRRLAGLPHSSAARELGIRRERAVYLDSISIAQELPSVREPPEHAHSRMFDVDTGERGVSGCESQYVGNRSGCGDPVGSQDGAV